MDLKELNTYTDEELGEIFNTITEIQRQRKEEKRKNLINNFKEAFLAMREANISITYFADDDYEVGLYDYDGFCYD